MEPLTILRNGRCAGDPARSGYAGASAFGITTVSALAPCRMSAPTRRLRRPWPRRRRRRNRTGSSSAVGLGSTPPGAGCGATGSMPTGSAACRGVVVEGCHGQRIAGCPPSVTTVPTWPSPPSVRNYWIVTPPSTAMVWPSHRRRRRSQGTTRRRRCPQAAPLGPAGVLDGLLLHRLDIGAWNPRGETAQHRGLDRARTDHVAPPRTAPQNRASERTNGGSEPLVIE